MKIGRQKSDIELFELMREQLYTPVTGDILGAVGCGRQFLPAYIVLLRDEMELTGRVYTVLEQNVSEPQKEPLGPLTEALDQLERDEVYLTTGAANSTFQEKLSATTTKAGGAAEAVLDRYTRDTPRVLQQDFPISAKGRWAQDSFIRTNMMDSRCRIEIRQVVIDDGDIVFGNMDDVLIIPCKAEAECIKRAPEEAADEKMMRKAIEEGVSATETFRKSETLQEARQRNTHPLPRSQTGNGQALV